MYVRTRRDGEVLNGAETSLFGNRWTSVQIVFRQFYPHGNSRLQKENIQSYSQEIESEPWDYCANALCYETQRRMCCVIILERARNEA